MWHSAVYHSVTVHYSIDALAARRRAARAAVTCIHPLAGNEGAIGLALLIHPPRDWRGVPSSPRPRRTAGRHLRAGSQNERSAPPLGARPAARWVGMLFPVLAGPPAARGAAEVFPKRIFVVLC